jgi:hypothetical protein
MVASPYNSFFESKRSGEIAIGKFAKQQVLRIGISRNCLMNILDMGC